MADDRKTAREETKRQKEIEKAAEAARKEAAKAARKPSDVAGEQKWTGEGAEMKTSGGPRAAAVLPDLPTMDEAMKTRLGKDKRNKLLLDLGILAGLALLVLVLVSS
ncbi:MAG: hypothetical protein WC876_12320, partial [Candidatus Thermoplasmatota archaeon]